MGDKWAELRKLCDRKSGTLTVGDGIVSDVLSACLVPELLTERDELQKLVREWWEWQRGCQELPPDDLSDRTKKAIGEVS